MRLALVIVPLLFAGPASAYVVTDGSASPADAALLSQAADALKDPESAEFRHLARNPNGDTLCGEVNAKSSAGGYVGYTAFFVNADGFKLGPVDQVWHFACEYSRKVP